MTKINKKLKFNILINKNTKKLLKQRTMSSALKSNPSYSLVVEHNTVWKPVAEPSHDSRFRYTVYMTEKEIVCPKQGYPSVVMIVHRDDWKMMSHPSTTHDGAFGRDFAPVEFNLPKKFL